MMSKAFDALQEFSNPIQVGMNRKTSEPKSYIFDISPSYRVLIDNNMDKAVIKCPWHPDFGRIPHPRIGEMKTYTADPSAKRRGTGWTLSHAAVGWFEQRPRFDYFRFVLNDDNDLREALALIKQWADKLGVYEGLIAMFGAGRCPTVAELRDARDRSLREVIDRPGAYLFRSDVLAAYDCKCAVTRCDIQECLDAAHIVPYLGPETDIVTNGICLRADVHRLFDRGALWIDPEARSIDVSDSLRGRMSIHEYRVGEQIDLPSAEERYPEPSFLRCRFALRLAEQ